MILHIVHKNVLMKGRHKNDKTYAINRRQREMKGCGKNWDDPEKAGSYITECFEGNLCPDCKKAESAVLTGVKDGK